MRDAFYEEMDSLREQVRERDAEIARLREWRDGLGRYICDLRSVESPCKRCDGLGVRAYSDTSTWSQGIGGQAITTDVCDACWGTGDAERSGANLRKMGAEIERLRADVERLTRERTEARDDLEEESHALLDAKKEVDALRAEVERLTPTRCPYVALLCATCRGDEMACEPVSSGVKWVDEERRSTADLGDGRTLVVSWADGAPDWWRVTLRLDNNGASNGFECLGWFKSRDAAKEAAERAAGVRELIAPKCQMKDLPNHHDLLGWQEYAALPDCPNEAQHEIRHPYARGGVFRVCTAHNLALKTQAAMNAAERAAGSRS